MKSWLKSGTPWIWLTAGAVSLSLIALVGLLLLLAGNGLRYFWPAPVYQFSLSQAAAGDIRVIGEIYRQQSISRQQLLDAGVVPSAALGNEVTRYLIKVGHLGDENQDFRTLLGSDIRDRSAPRDLLALERVHGGSVYGRMVGMLENDQPLTGSNLRQELQRRIAVAQSLNRQIDALKFGPMAQSSLQWESLRQSEQRQRRAAEPDVAELSHIKVEKEALQRRLAGQANSLTLLLQARDRDALLLQDMYGSVHTLPLSEVRAAWYPNDMSWGQKVTHWGGKIGRFIADSPHDAGSGGGVFPAIFGTVLMVILMSVVVMPLGVVAAVYLHEYAQNNLLTRLIRIAVVNLAGVPSIVYGVFGLGFFVYLLGGSLDRLLFPESLPNPTFGTPGVLWAALTLALLTLPVVIVATEEGLTRIPQSLRQGSLALGASKIETLWHIVLPLATPAMMTGLILAVARAAGETAPLMLVGVVKSVPVLPLDGVFPYLHLERKFMHLSFQIYDMAFQSPNVEAARPLVYATALLLVIIVVSLNLAAIGIRHHLREKYRALTQ